MADTTFVQTHELGVDPEQNMRQEDLNTLLGLAGILISLKLGLVAILVAAAFMGGLMLGRATPRGQRSGR